MGIVGGVAGGVFEYVSWLMGLAPLCKALYTNRLLVEKMFEKIGSIIVKVDEGNSEDKKAYSAKNGR